MRVCSIVLVAAIVVVVPKMANTEESLASSRAQCQKEQDQCQQNCTYNYGPMSGPGIAQPSSERVDCDGRCKGDWGVCLTEAADRERETKARAASPPAQLTCSQIIQRAYRKCGNDWTCVRLDAGSGCWPTLRRLQLPGDKWTCRSLLNDIWRMA